VARAQCQRLFAQLDGFLVLAEAVAQVTGQREETGVFGRGAACFRFQRGDERYGALRRDADDFPDPGVAVRRGCANVCRRGTAGSEQ